MAVPAEFPAHAFHPSLPGGKASGTLRVYEHGLVFSSDTQTVTLPLHGLSLKLGGAGNRIVFCTHPAFAEWQVYTADRSLLKLPLLAGHQGMAAVKAQKRQHHTTFWGLLAGSLVTVALLVLGIWWSLDAMSAAAARQVPVEWEDKLGSSVIAQYRIGKDLMPDKEALPLLKPLTNPLVQALPRDGRHYTLHFHVVNDPAINAFALPGGYVVINSGLILNAKTATELQGVLGHEIAHVTEQHGVRAVIRSTGIYVIAQTLIGDASGLIAVAANAGPLLLNMKYSRDFEREADAKGFELLKRAQIDPRGMVTFFRTVQAEQKKQMDKIPDENARKAMEAAQGFIGSHPETVERIATLQKRADSEPATGWRDDQAAFLALQESVKEFVRADAADAEAEKTEKGEQAQ
ncbi:MAG: M48 family metallopeptidase [Pedobacter sp.]|nr:M48 family metallopeptidase [Pedobacter sp.]